jgi:hypothetical protein
VRRAQGGILLFALDARAMALDYFGGCGVRRLQRFALRGECALRLGVPVEGAPVEGALVPVCAVRRAGGFAARRRFRRRDLARTEYTYPTAWPSSSNSSESASNASSYGYAVVESTKYARRGSGVRNAAKAWDESSTTTTYAPLSLLKICTPSSRCRNTWQLGEVRIC